MFINNCEFFGYFQQIFFKFADVENKLLIIKSIQMNKAELIGSIAEKAGFTKVQAKIALDAFVCATSEALAKGEKVSLVGFGTFAVVKRAARKGRNPQTKKEMDIPAKNVIKFKPGTELTEAI